MKTYPILWLLISLSTACVAVPKRSVTHSPGFIQFGPERTVLIDINKETSWKWFVATILPEDPHDDDLGDSFWTEPTTRTRYVGTKVVDMGDSTCRWSKRDQGMARQIERHFQQRVLPGSIEATSLRVGPDYTLQVVREGDHPALRVEGSAGSRLIDLGALETKVYWIEGSALAQSAGRLLSLSTGAVFAHHSRYVRAFLHGKRLFVLLAYRGGSEIQGELLELSYPELERVRSIYRGSELIPVDYDGARFLFASPSEVAVFEVEGDRWLRTSYTSCKR